jgi:hypothetical protein
VYPYGRVHFKLKCTKKGYPAPLKARVPPYFFIIRRVLFGPFSA